MISSSQHIILMNTWLPVIKMMYFFWCFLWMQPLHAEACFIMQMVVAVIHDVKILTTVNCKKFSSLIYKKYSDLVLNCWFTFHFAWENKQGPTFHTACLSS